MTMTATERPAEVEFDPGAYPNIVDAYRHEDGSITYVVIDTDSSGESPREYGGNVATLIQGNTRCIDVDDDDEGLEDARNHFWDYGSRHGRQGWRRAGHSAETMVRRYLAIFRPEIVYYTEYWVAGDSYGWGYVTRANWDAAMGQDYTGDVTPEQAFDQEVSLYRQWAEGDIYGAYHVTVGEPIVRFWDHGAYIDGYDTDDESCWGFLGYDDHRQIATQFTDSPIAEVLA